jgi:hypothetical protein
MDAAVRPPDMGDHAGGDWDVAGPVPQVPRATADVSAYADLLNLYDWDVARMTRIAACESNFDENAISPDGQNVGLLQINLVHGWTTEQLTDPAFNIAAGYDVWLSQGYAAWACDRG